MDTIRKNKRLVASGRTDGDDKRASCDVALEVLGPVLDHVVARRHLVAGVVATSRRDRQTHVVPSDGDLPRHRPGARLHEVIGARQEDRGVGICGRGKALLQVRLASIFNTESSILLDYATPNQALPQGE